MSAFIAQQQCYDQSHEGLIPTGYSILFYLTWLDPTLYHIIPCNPSEHINIFLIADPSCPESIPINHSTPYPPTDDDKRKMNIISIKKHVPPGAYTDRWHKLLTGNSSQPLTIFSEEQAKGSSVYYKSNISLRSGLGGVRDVSMTIIWSMSHWDWPLKTRTKQGLNPSSSFAHCGACWMAPENFHEDSLKHAVPSSS